jgi:uncharacterized protein
MMRLMKMVSFAIDDKLPMTIKKQHIIIFTRYPEAGKTKTRLIPALGTKGAADLHRQMTEHTLTQVKQLQSNALSFEVRFTGGDLQLMQGWLGSDASYQFQGDGDLGQRMARSLLEAFQSGAEKAVLIGTDCPDVSAEILAQALAKLYHYNLVLGPAMDGGYYLVGLQYPIPELFIDIDWGTAKVLQQTVEIAENLNLSFVYLPYLADIDRPEDLSIWEKYRN